MTDIFDQMALSRSHPETIFRGDSLPYTTNAERIQNGKLARAAHRDVLARCMRDGCRNSEFKNETMHLHGGSNFGMPFEMMMAFDHEEFLSGEMCWRIVLHCSKMDAEPWPGLDSRQLSSKPSKQAAIRKRGRPKGSGSLAQNDAPFVTRMHELLASGEASSIQSAAMSVAKDAAGHGTLESKRDRLVRRFRSECKTT